MFRKIGGKISLQTAINYLLRIKMSQDQKTRQLWLLLTWLPNYLPRGVIRLWFAALLLYELKQVIYTQPSLLYRNSNLPLATVAIYK